MNTLKKSKTYAPMVIFQNYFAPYRHKLFTEIAKHLPLTVVYMQMPEEEGRVWSEADHAPQKNYDTIQLTNKRLSRVKPFSQVVWVQGLNELKQKIKKGTKVVLLDNMPTNFTMLRIIGKLKHIPIKDRILWNEHILPQGEDGWLKNLYKKVMTVLLALNVNTILSFSAMNQEYLKTLGIPMVGQKVVRTIEALYTEEELQALKHQSFNTSKREKKSIAFGFMGYFSERKGLREMLTAMKYYKNPKARFVFAGTGPMENELKKAAEQDSRISVYPKYQTEAEKTKYLGEMDVHVVPSFKDPWAITINEAASRGVPSLVSPNVGASELMRKIDKNFVLDNNRAITIAKAFTELEQKFARKAEWGRLREETREVGAKWTIETAAEAFLKIAKHADVTKI